MRLLGLLPDFSKTLSAGSRDILLHSFFKIGPLPVTPLFLLKAGVFLFLLISLSKLLQRVLLGGLFRKLGISEGQKFALERFATYLFIFGGLFIGLQSLGVNLSSLLVFGGALDVGVGLGLQNVVSNFVAGIILLIEQPIRIDDRIETGNTLGDVVKIAARSTWVRTNDNVVIIVPNNDFINNFGNELDSKRSKCANFTFGRCRLQLRCRTSARLAAAGSHGAFGSAQRAGSGRDIY